MKKFIFILMVFYVITTCLLVLYLFTVPDYITCYKNERYISIKTPIFIDIKTDQKNILQKAEFKFLKRINTFYLNGQDKDFICTIRVINIPIKTLRVSIVEKKKLLVSGEFIGIKMILNGILVIGYSKVNQNYNSIIPAKSAGIKVGDKIIKANGIDIYDCNNLYKIITSSKGKEITLTVKRGDILKDIKVKPILSSNGEYKIGLWVRDGTSGIGTLTYIDPNNLSFGALGHGISDIDTNILLDVKKGEIYKSELLSIRKNEDGEIGEVIGRINENRLGRILLNTPYGIYGKIDNIKKILIYDFVETGRIQDVHIGDAYLISSLNQQPERYKIKVTKILPLYNNSSKAFVIKITDRRLIERTGGIVQGMSGSPIIQDNKIVGAVTHVILKNSEMGYGVFIENMVNVTNKIN